MKIWENMGEITIIILKFQIVCKYLRDWLNRWIGRSGNAAFDDWPIGQGE